MAERAHGIPPPPTTSMFDATAWGDTSFSGSRHEAVLFAEVDLSDVTERRAAFVDCTFRDVRVGGFVAMLYGARHPGPAAGLVPDPDTLARRTGNPAIAEPGFHRLQELDVVGQLLRRIDRPTLVCVGALDGVTPPDASREIVAALHPASAASRSSRASAIFPGSTPRNAAGRSSAHSSTMSRRDGPDHDP